jgi:DNA-binding YbaB/EbfC family protein
MKVRIPNQGGGNPQAMMRQITKLQEDMKNKQEELDAREFDVSAGGGMVKIKMLGTKQITSIKIDPSIVSNEAEDIEMLEDMLIAGINEAIETVEKTVDEEMSKLTKGANLPNIPGLT